MLFTLWVYIDSAVRQSIGHLVHHIYSLQILSQID